MVAGALEHEGEGAPRRSALRDLLASVVARQEGRTFLWSPIALTFGIWSYFGVEREPAGFAVGLAALLAILLLWLGRRFPFLVLLGLLVMGFALAKHRADWTATPLLHVTTGEVQVTGMVLDVAASSARRMTLILATEQIEGLTAADTPKRLRLSASLKTGKPAIGTRIAFKARLTPNPTPVAPGGFDYGRRLWFEGIGGAGRITAPIILLAEAHPPPMVRLDSWLEMIRATMGQRIRAVLDEPIASFAEALITGERSTIPKDLNHSLLVSGLFHILSISGLHMWLVAGGVFWSVRAGLALIPALAVNYPIKKWAAAAALVMGWFYMLLADSGVATERSFIMIAVVFFAVLVDRPALSTRNLAIAAIVVLVFEPEAAIEASFQMSFLAVLGLVAFYEGWSRLQSQRDPGRLLSRSWLHKLVRSVLQAVFLGLATTLIAGSMSSIPAAYHFGRLAPYAVIANGLTLPVVGFLVMPPALLATLLMPLGLEGPPLWVMGKGLELVLLISDWVATFPGAYVVVPQPPGLAAVLLALGASVLCLLVGPLRWLGVALMAGGLVHAAIPATPPDLLIERTASNVAFRNANGEWVPAHARRSRFTVEKWLLANGEEVTPAAAARRTGWTCTGDRCTTTLKGKRIAYLVGEGPATDCDGLDLLIARFPLRGACRSVPLRIDRFDVWRMGAHAISLTRAGFVVSTARGEQGQRPWVVDPQPRRTPYRKPDGN